MKKSSLIQRNKGMTYVELIVVLGIFAVMSSIVMYNYGEFQARIDIKNLASDIALKIVEAQKSSVNGKWNSNASDDWKPSYGVRFNKNSEKLFTYFADINPDKSYGPGDWGDPFTIVQNAFISDVKCGTSSISTTVDIVFIRPDFRAWMMPACPNDETKIVVSSPRSAATATITIYNSGRIQVN